MASSSGDLTSNVRDVALVFEGGGMRASGSAGVVVSLLKAGIHIDWVAGISAGASHTVNYLSRDSWRARRSFTEFAREPEFGNLRTFARGQGLFNSEFIYERASLPGEALPLDAETFTANPADFRIGTFNADTGQMRYLGRSEVTTVPELMTLCRASSSMPVVMPPVQHRGHLWVDGALGPSGGIPLDAAQQAGFTRFLVVLTRPRSYVKGPERFPHVYRTRFRRKPALVEALEQRPAHYNRTRQEVFDLEASGQAVVFAPEHMPAANGERRLPRLQASYAAGYIQAQRELPRWRDFLGV